MPSRRTSAVAAGERVVAEQRLHRARPGEQQQPGGHVGQATEDRETRRPAQPWGRFGQGPEELHGGLLCLSCPGGRSPRPASRPAGRTAGGAHAPAVTRPLPLKPDDADDDDERDEHDLGRREDFAVQHALPRRPCRRCRCRPIPPGRAERQRGQRRASSRCDARRPLAAARDPFAKAVDSSSAPRTRSRRPRRDDEHPGDQIRRATSRWRSVRGVAGGPRRPQNQ